MLLIRCTMKIKSTKIVGTPIVRNSFCSKMWQIMDMQVIIISIQKQLHIQRSGVLKLQIV